MNDQLRPVGEKLAADRGEVEQIQLRARQPAHAPRGGKPQGGLDEIISDQPVRAGDPG